MDFFGGNFVGKWNLYLGLVEAEMPRKEIDDVDTLMISDKSSDSAGTLKISTKLKKRGSISFPSLSKKSSSYENLLDARTGDSQNADENPNVSITVSDLVKHDIRNGTDVDVRPKEHEHSKTLVPEGNCIDPFCTTCPTSNHRTDNKSEAKHGRDNSKLQVPFIQMKVLAV